MGVEQLVEQLRHALDPDAVLAGTEASPDYGLDETLKATPVVPAAVVLPSTTAEVAAAVRVAAELGVAVTARGAGTGLSGACIPVPGGLVVSFERMASILEIDDASHVAVVQPGVTLAQLDAATSAGGVPASSMPRNSTSAVMPSPRASAA